MSKPVQEEPKARASDVPHPRVDLNDTSDDAYQSYPGYAELLMELAMLLQAGEWMEAHCRQGAWYKSLGILVIDGRHPIDDALDLAGDIPPWQLDLSLFKLPEGWTPPVDPDTVDPDA